MSIPNLISVLRICLVPLLVWMIIAGELKLACFTFLFAGASDALDGFLAKKFNWETELGAYLDPIADKMLLVGIYATLGYFWHMPVWFVILVISRDFLIISAIILAWMLERPVRMRPLLVSKANTAGQILLAFLVLANLGFHLGQENNIIYLTWLVSGLTILSTLAYMIGWLHHMSHDEQADMYSMAQSYKDKTTQEKNQNRTTA